MLHGTQHHLHCMFVGTLTFTSIAFLRRLRDMSYIVQFLLPSPYPTYFRKTGCQNRPIDVLNVRTGR